MAESPENPKRILIVRPSALGDVARTVPCLVSLKSAYPDARIDWVINDTFRDVIAAHPALHRAIEFPRKQFKKIGRSFKATRAGLAWSRQLRDAEYDLVIDLQGLARSGLISWLTRAPRRFGPAHAREGATMFYTHRIRVEDRVHTVDQMMGVIEALGISPIYDMRLYTTGVDRVWAKQCCVKNKLEPGKYAVIAPTARWPSKQWPAERYGEIIKKLESVGIQRAVVVAAERERDSIQSLLTTMDPSGQPVVDLVGATTVGQLMAIIEHAGVVICNDSAALHIAVGFGRRAVAIFGPTDPAFVGPFRYHQSVVKPTTSKQINYRAMGVNTDLIESIQTDAVFARLQAIMQQTPPSPWTPPNS